MNKKLITKNELKEIKKYWHQQGGFGGWLSSGVRYHSETLSYCRVGVLELEEDDCDKDIYYIPETLSVYFCKDDTQKDIEEKVVEAVRNSGLILRSDFKLVKEVEI